MHVTCQQLNHVSQGQVRKKTHHRRQQTIQHRIISDQYGPAAGGQMSEPIIYTVIFLGITAFFIISGSIHERFFGGCIRKNPCEDRCLHRDYILHGIMLSTRIMM